MLKPRRSFPLMSGASLHSVFFSRRYRDVIISDKQDERKNTRFFCKLPFILIRHISHLIYTGRLQSRVGRISYMLCIVVELILIFARVSTYHENT